MIYLASLVEETQDKIDGYKIIHTKKELDKIICDNLKSHRVVIRKDFASKFFTPIGLSNYIKSAKSINVNIIIDLDMDSDVLTNDKMIRKLERCCSVEEMIDLAVGHTKEYIDTIDYLIKHRNTDTEKMLQFSNQVARLQSIIDEQQKVIEDQKYTINQEVRNKLSYQSQLHALISRINYQYDKHIDKDRLFTIDNNTYDKVLYIKEYSRVQYVDTLVYYLKEILRTIYGMPTRLLVVESYYAEGKVSMYPNLKPHHNLIERDVLSGDILMLGMQPILMQNILKNPSNISILIVLDRGGYAVPHIKGNNVEMIYTFSDMSDKPEWIPDGRCISYEKNTLNIPLIKDFKNLDASQKIAEYSSLEIVMSLIQLLERR